MKYYIYTLLSVAWVLLPPAGAGGGGERVLYGTSSSFSRWSVSGTAGSVDLSVTEAPAGVEGGALRARARFPGRLVLSAVPDRQKRRWSGWRRLRMRVFCPGEQPDDLELRVVVEDRYMHRYSRRLEGTLRAGSWSTLHVKLRDDRAAWRPEGHRGRWDGYSPGEIRRLGLRIRTSEDRRLTFYLGRVALSGAREGRPDNAILHLRQNRASVPRYGRFEVSFGLRRTYSNPFNPDIVSVEGVFVRPDDSRVRVPGFFYQGYSRELEGGRERLTPTGARHWKVRFAPRQTGVYSYYIEVDDGETLRSPVRTFRATSPSDTGAGRGFVRLSGSDSAYFEFDDGSLFYPVGHNIAAPRNFRRETLAGALPPGQGTYAYDRFLSRMSESGENFGRVWMVPPAFELEWSRSYSPHYQGSGRYNLRKAWQLDHVVQQARDQDVYLLLTITTNRELARFGSHFGADSSGRGGFPYAAHNGGPLEDPAGFFTSEEARKLYRRKLRYIAARWGYATSVMGWELLDEPDRLQFYRNSYSFARQAADLVESAGGYLEEKDPADHLFTSNCYQYRSESAAPVLSLDVVDFTTGHIYASDLESRLSSAHRYMNERYEKIFLATETGVTPFAQDPQLTERTIHRMLWASHMMPLAGTAMPWWWEIIDGRDLYHHFAALQAFAEGQDRRGEDYHNVSSSVSAAAGPRDLQILTLTTGEKALCWIYEPTAFKPRAQWKGTQQSAADVSIPGMEPGPYRVEVWDTDSGSVRQEKDVVRRADDGPLTFSVPSFGSDIAVKVLRPGAAR